MGETDVFPCFRQNDALQFYEVFLILLPGFAGRMPLLWISVSGQLMTSTDRLKIFLEFRLQQTSLPWLCPSSRMSISISFATSDSKNVKSCVPLHKLLNQWSVKKKEKRSVILNFSVDFQCQDSNLEPWTLAPYPTNPAVPAPKPLNFFF